LRAGRSRGRAVGRQALRLAVFAFIVWGAGCRSVPDQGPVAGVAPVWPLPPAPPRIRYVQSLSQPADAGIRTSIWRRAARWVLGTRRDERLIRPVGLFIGDDGTLSVADAGSGAISVYDFTRHTVQRWDHIGKLRFVEPVSVAKCGTALFVSEPALGRVVSFDTDGYLRFELTGDLKRPSGLTISGAALLVADSAAHCIRVYDLDGRPVRQFGRRGAGPGEFNFPTHVSADSAGRIYVTDAMNSRIQIFGPDGQFLRTIGSLGDSTGHFSRPKGTAVDRFGHIYVVDALFDNVQVFDPEGRFLLSWGEAGSNPGEFWLPAGIAIGPDSLIAVADAYNARIQLFRYMGED